MRLLPILAAALLSAAAAHPRSALAQVGTVPFWSFQGPLSWGLTEPMERVIRTQDDFRKLWAGVHTTLANEGRTLPRAPLVDFRAEMVIAVGMGQRPHGGYQVRVERIEDTGERLRVFYSAYSPGEKCMTAQSITSPVALVRLPMSQKPVTFAAARETRDCSE
jgi:hypothetical protein